VEVAAQAIGEMVCPHRGISHLLGGIGRAGIARVDGAAAVRTGREGLVVHALGSVRDLADDLEPIVAATCRRLRHGVC